MLYTEMTKKAMAIAYNAHHGQKDKSGVPYVFHPFHVAEQMEDEDSTVVALLHDVVEDTPVTFSDLEKEGFPEEILEALKLLTRKKGVSYQDYIKKIKENPLATRVKLADLDHNRDISRLGKMTKQDKERLRRYEQAVKFLSEE